MPIQNLYARGKKSKAQCPKCGDVIRYTELVRDWRGTWLCKECWDPQHPQERPPRNVVDAVTLRHPRPLLDTPVTPITVLGVQSTAQLGEFSVSIT